MVGDETAIVKAYEHKAAAIVESAKSIRIVDEDSRKIASTFAMETRSVRREIEERRKEITGPLNQSLKKINGMFKELDGRFAEAQEIVDGEIRRDYIMVSETQAAAEEMLRLQAEKQRAETGEWVPNPILPPIEKTVQMDNGSVTLRKDIKITVLDKPTVIKAIADHKLPMLLVEIDLGAVKRYAKSAGFMGNDMPGFLIESDAVVSGRSK